jgi:hypothetical protein
LYGSWSPNINVSLDASSRIALTFTFRPFAFNHTGKVRSDKTSAVAHYFLKCVFGFCPLPCQLWFLTFFPLLRYDFVQQIVTASFATLHYVWLWPGAVLTDMITCKTSKT